MLSTPLEQRVWEAAKRRASNLAADEVRTGGVVHTPPDLARVQVRALDRLMVEQGVVGGLGGPETVVVDLACGTGAFVAAVLALCSERGTAPRAIVATDVDREAVHAMDALCRPAAVEQGCELLSRCENSLAHRPSLPGGGARVVAVVGNPPWTAARRSAAAVSDGLVADFRVDENGVRLRGGKAGVLGDAYVHFLRVAAAYAALGRQAGCVALWTNGSYLQGPNYRGLRRSLLSWFGVMQVVDCGGSALLSRSVQDRADRNLFGVRTSVALTMAVRHGAPSGLAQVRAYRLRGGRAGKVSALSDIAVGRATGQVGAPSAPAYRFDLGPRVCGQYAAAVGLHEMIPWHVEGVQTNRDRAVVAESEQALFSRLEGFVRHQRGGVFDLYEKRSEHYDPELARAAVASVLGQAGGERRWARPLAYRPFQDRGFCPIPPLCHRPRARLQRAVDHSDVVFLTVARDRGTGRYHHAAVSRYIADSSYLSSRSSCRTRVMPERTAQGELNLDFHAAAPLAERLGRSVQPTDVFALAFGLLSNRRYLARFGESLSDDFPRLLLPSTDRALRALLDAGEMLMHAFLPHHLPEAGGCKTEDGDEGAQLWMVGQHRLRPTPRLARALDEIQNMEL